MTTLPQCMQCSSYNGEMDGEAFRCKSCGSMTDQPEEIWKPKPKPNTLKILLEAYDEGTAPFNQKSDASELLPLVIEEFRPILASQIMHAEMRAEDQRDTYFRERKQALIEAVSDALAGFPGFSEELVAMIEEYLPDADA